jgi:hypothetical protein
MLFPGSLLFAFTYEIVKQKEKSYKRRHPSARLLAYEEALRLYESYVAAARKAEEAAHEIAVERYLREQWAEQALLKQKREAEEALLRQKRSYWERLNGYEFEIATAEVLKLHQFNPRVTGGSADGGVDIEVARDGRKGVVQCKAHVACVGPHTVRDLFGVMHHSGCDFGIIVSRGGFTKGAIDFAKNKLIFLVDTSDLVAMQEGKDALAGGFTRTEPTPREAKLKEPAKLDFTGKESLGKCPRCGRKISETETSYICERSQADRQPCKFKLSKAILGREIPKDQAQKLLATGKTDLLDGFISKRGRPFFAYLKLEDGKVSFEFPEQSSSPR